MVQTLDFWDPLGSMGSIGEDGVPTIDYSGGIYIYIYIQIYIDISIYVYIYIFIYWLSSHVSCTAATRFYKAISLVRVSWFMGFLGPEKGQPLQDICISGSPELLISS